MCGIFYLEHPVNAAQGRRASMKHQQLERVGFVGFNRQLLGAVLVIVALLALVGFALAGDLTPPEGEPVSWIRGEAAAVILLVAGGVVWLWGHEARRRALDPDRQPGGRILSQW